MVLSQKLHEAFKGTVERITGPRTVSAFKEKGVLSISEFVIAGDNLVSKCPTWSWYSISLPLYSYDPNSLFVCLDWDWVHPNWCVMAPYQVAGFKLSLKWWDLTKGIDFERLFIIWVFFLWAIVFISVPLRESFNLCNWFYLPSVSGGVSLNVIKCCLGSVVFGYFVLNS